MFNELIIREYNSNDKSQLIKILRLNVPKYFAKSEVEDFSVYLDYKIERYFVAEIRDRIVGGGGINFDDDGKTGKISWDFIDPAFQEKGVGQKLLKYRIELLKSLKKIDSIRVRTSQLAYKFYEKNGFTLQETIKDYWAKGFDLYDMIMQIHKGN